MRNLHQIINEMASKNVVQEVEEPRGEAEKNFKGKHEVSVKADAAGNGDEVFKGSGTKKKKRKADYESPEDEIFYEDAEESDDIDESKKLLNPKRDPKMGDEYAKKSSNKPVRVSFHDENAMKRWMKVQSLDKNDNEIINMSKTHLDLVPEMRKYISKVKHGDMIYQIKDIKEDLDERELSASEEKKKEEIVKGMKDNEAELKKKYGDDWKSVMYATATKRAKESMNEAVEVSHDRYMRSHGKKASGRGGMWMFTNKRSGDVDYDNEEEVFQPKNFSSKSFTDAAKEAKEWAKKNGHSTIYVMESLDEEYLEEATKIDDYELKTTGKKKSTTAHPNGKPVYEVLYKGEKVGTVEPYSAYKDTKKPGARIVSSRKEVTRYSYSFEQGKGPERGEVSAKSKHDHLNAKHAFEHFVMMHSRWAEKNMNEAKKMKDDPCWDDYEMVGKKKKNGKEVPNCVPEEVELDEYEELDELSKKTVQSYLDKNIDSKKDGYDSPRKFRNRMTSGATAYRKLGKKIPGMRSQPKVKIKATNEELDESKWVVTVNGKDGYGVFDNEADAKKKAQEVRKNLKKDDRTATVSVIKEEIKENYPMAQSVGMPSVSYEYDHDNTEIEFLEQEILSSLVASMNIKLQYVFDSLDDGTTLPSYYIDTLLSMRNTVNSMYQAVLDQENGVTESHELDENNEFDKYIDTKLEEKEILQFLDKLSEKNQAKAKKMMDSDEGLEKLKNFIKKHG